MRIKTNENKNRINLPTSLASMAVNHKVGIFFSKEKRTQELEEENQVLEQKLQEVVQNLESQNEHLKQIKTKNNVVENLLSVLVTENEFFEQENHKIEDKLAFLIEEKETLKKKEKELTRELLEIQKLLFENTNKNQEHSTLLQRYQEEIKNEKTLRIAPDSIFNLVSKLEKEVELLNRNIVIHENKLEGKKKYCKLLETKEKKEQNKEQIIKKEPITKPSLNIYDKNYGSATNLELKKKQLEMKEKEKQNEKKEDKKPDMKSLNDLIRKKNALMSSNKNN